MRQLRWIYQLLTNCKCCSGIPAIIPILNFNSQRISIPILVAIYAGKGLRYTLPRSILKDSAMSRINWIGFTGLFQSSIKSNLETLSREC